MFVSTKKRLLRKAWVYKPCTPVGNDTFTCSFICGHCNRGIFKNPKIGKKCKVCKAEIDHMWCASK